MSSVPPPTWHSESSPPADPPPPRPSSTSLRPRILAAIVGVLALAAVAFALLGSSATKVTDPVAEAATLSSSAAGYRVHMLINVSSPSFGTAITGVGDGRVDARDHAAALTLAMDLGASPQVTQALGTSTLRMTELVDGTTVYMRLPALATGALGSSGKPWVKIDLGKALHLPGIASMGSNPAMGDPSQMLQYLRAVSDSVVSEGRQRVGGFETTRYHANISLDRVLSALPSADRTAAQDAISGLEQATQLHAIPVDVWIDRRHLVRRMSMTMSAALGGGQSMGLGLTMDYSDFGPQPRPALPPAGDVQDISALPAAG